MGHVSTFDIFEYLCIHVFPSMLDASLSNVTPNPLQLISYIIFLGLISHGESFLPS
jgi:hypothetical protein